MPRECKDMRAFLEKLMPKTPDQKRTVFILEKKTGNKCVTKFKVKTRASGLHTLVIADRSKAIKLEKALPGNCEKRYIGKSASKTKKN